MVQQNRVHLVVMSDGPSSKLRAAGQVFSQCGTGWALELGGKSKLCCPLVNFRDRAKQQLGQTEIKLKRGRHNSIQYKTISAKRIGIMFMLFEDNA